MKLIRNLILDIQLFIHESHANFFENAFDRTMLPIYKNAADEQWRIYNTLKAKRHEA